MGQCIAAMICQIVHATVICIKMVQADQSEWVGVSHLCVEVPTPLDGLLTSSQLVIWRTCPPFSDELSMRLMSSGSCGAPNCMKMFDL